MIKIGTSFISQHNNESSLDFSGCSDRPNLVSWNPGAMLGSRVMIGLLPLIIFYVFDGTISGAFPLSLRVKIKAPTCLVDT